MDQALPEDKFAEVFVRSQQEGIGVAAFKKHGLIVDSRIKLSYELNTVPISAKAFNDLSIYAFVRDNIQLAFSKG